MSYLVIKDLSARLKGTNFPILRRVSLRVAAGAPAAATVAPSPPSTPPN